MPQASAVLPVMFRYTPGWILAFGTKNETGNSSVVSPKWMPALSDLRFASSTSALKRACIHSRVVSTGRP